MNAEEVVRGLLSGNRRALARAITYVENEYPESKEIMKQIYPKTGKAHVVGLTGFPGVGKSTIVSKLTEEFRRRGKRVGIIAIDPGSPFTGGALLGDRLRLDGMDTRKPLWTDPGVFFRSMSSRGRAGGLAAKTGDVVRLLDAFGFDIILVETVGAGQSEVDIIEVADTSVVVLMPETGDEIQVNKAGILEIGDIYVVNKADLGGAEKVERWLQYMLSLDEESVQMLSQMTHADEARLASGEFFERRKGWNPPVIKTVADRGEGIRELADAIEEHFEYMKKTGLIDKRRRERVKRELFEIVMNDVIKLVKEKTDYREMIMKLLKGETDPYTAAEQIVEEVIHNAGKE
uniref:Methylmalonyl Co-A mutase-associated GTPase MeaB n=1 Tax=Archaeoglobus fulgidus TaxID=2234 RepID=A0A7C3RCM9_ARCFL